MKKYIIEVRDENGKLVDFETEEKKKKEHPEFFTQREYTIDRLCWLASYAGGRNTPMGPMQLGEFMKSIGISYRVKYW